MGTDISGIAKSVLNARVNANVKPVEKEVEEAMTISFMELMNQGNLPSGADTVESSANDMVIDTDHTTQDAYEACSNPNKKVTVRKEVSAEEMSEESAEALDEYEEEIRKILKEQFGVTDEEISQAMEDLGMSFLDFRNLQSFASLIQMLTGEDVGAMFLSDTFQNVMEQITALTDELCKELGVTREEWNILCETWSQMEKENVSQVEAEVTETLIDTSVLAEETLLSQSANESVEAIVEQQETVAQASNEEAVTLIPVEEDVPEQTEDSLEPQEVILKTEEASDENSLEMKNDTESQNGNLFEHSQNSKKEVSDIGVNVIGQQNIRTENFAIPQETVLSYTGQIDLTDVMAQVTRNIQVTITETITSMEMQLNPENLGKIYLNVSEQEGLIRAQFAVQNETIKEALETQIVELRQTLSQQGVKVDAIEVTIASHEFEQNLEEHAKQEEQLQQQMEETQKRSRRNINLDEIEELSGLMTEEEQLVAQMMRDNGNQVDLTA